MDPSEVLAVVEEQVAAFNARDLERFLGCYATDATYVDGKGVMLLQGAEAFHAFYGPLFAQSPDLHAQIVNRIQVGPWIVDEERCTGIVLVNTPPELHAVMVYHVADGKIQHTQLLI
jgi:uncharacterized protein (TIGR02246 family)